MQNPAAECGAEAAEHRFCWGYHFAAEACSGSELHTGNNNNNLLIPQHTKTVPKINSPP